MKKINKYAHKKRIDELYRSLFKYLDQLEEIGLNDRPVSEEIFKLYAKDAEELGNLLIEEGKNAGQISIVLEKEMKKKLMETLEIFKIKWKY